MRFDPIQDMSNSSIGMWNWFFTFNRPPADHTSNNSFATIIANKGSTRISKAWRFPTNSKITTANYWIWFWNIMKTLANSSWDGWYANISTIIWFLRWIWLRTSPSTCEALFFWGTQSKVFLWGWQTSRLDVIVKNEWNVQFENNIVIISYTINILIF